MADIDRNLVSNFVRALTAIEQDASGEPIQRGGYIKVLLGRSWRVAKSGGTRARCDWSTGDDVEQLTDAVIRMVEGEVEAEKAPGKCWVHAYMTGETSPCRTLAPIAYEPTDMTVDVPDTQSEALLRVTMELLKTNVTLTKDVRTMSRDQMELAYKLGEASAEARSGAEAAQWQAMAAATPHFLALAERVLANASEPVNDQELGEETNAAPKTPVETWDQHARQLDQHAAALFGLIAQGRVGASEGRDRVSTLSRKLRQALDGIEALQAQPGWA